MAAAEQLRSIAADADAGWALVTELAPFEQIGARPLLGVADWLDARAGLYGVTASSPTTVAGFDDD